MKHSIRAILLTAFLPFAAHAATIYNAAADFSITDGNPNGVWTYASASSTYGTGSQSISAITNFTYAGSHFTDQYAGDYGFNYWSTGADGFPVIGHEPGANTDINNGSVNVPAKELFLHPSDNGRDAVLIFTAPATAHYAFDANFFRRDNSNPPGGDGVNVSLFIDGVFYAGGLLPASFYGQAGSLGFDGTLAQGTVLAFDVNKNGSYGNDSTGLDLSISQTAVTPEPSSLALLGTGVLGAAGMARRKFRRS